VSVLLRREKKAEKRTARGKQTNFARNSQPSDVVHHANRSARGIGESGVVHAVQEAVVCELSEEERGDADERVQILTAKRTQAVKLDIMGTWLLDLNECLSAERESGSVPMLTVRMSCKIT
jgi:hypothetical protein